MSNAVLVIGGGVAGIRAALDLADGGSQVVLVEKEPILGGAMASRLGEDAENPLAGVDLPKAKSVADHANIEVLTLAEVTDLAGEAGQFTATIRQRARFVTEACTECNKCRQVCPVVLPNEYEAGLAFRKAIFTPLKECVPATYVIDIARCLNDPPNYLACQRCVEVCEDNAIDFNMPLEQSFEREAGSVIVSVGYDVTDSSALRKYGYGTYPDVLTSAELERLLTPAGPTGGFLEKPSNEETPENVLVVLDDDSPLAWSYSSNHAARLVDQDIEDITVLHREADASLWNGAGGESVKLVQGAVEKVQDAPHHTLRVRYKDAANDRTVTQEFDLVVLSSAVEPPAGLNGLADTLGIQLAGNGFVQLDGTDLGSVATSREGICVLGCATGPKNVPETLAGGQAAVAYAKEYLGRKRSVAVAAVAEAAPEAAANGRTGIVVNGQFFSEQELHRRIQKFVWSIIEYGKRSVGSEPGTGGNGS